MTISPRISSRATGAAAIAALLVAALGVTPSTAQTWNPQTGNSQTGSPQNPPAGGPPPGTRPPAKAQPQAKRPPDQPSAGTESGLRQRIEQLEEQLVDLQVHVGTVESMSRGGSQAGAPSYRGGAPAGGSGADAGRIAALETQVQALTSQLESMAAQLRSLQGGAPRGPSGPAPRVGGFGAATVVSPDDPIANILNAPDARGAAPRSAPVAAAPAPAGFNPASRQQYDQAYTLLLQQNYPAAESSFAEFLQQNPRDELAPNAQFWLGETYFVRGQWDSAAAAFLKVAQNFPKAEKAPDSLAKLAMSMERKGNKPAACRALQELNTRYPSPPAHVRSWSRRSVAVPDARDQPLDADALSRRARAAFGDFSCVVLAVSGGPDSLMLLHLARARRALADAPEFHVATVNHGWRPEAALEAAWVGEQARSLGFPHHLLEWRGEKPLAGRQEAARQARYDLLGDLARRLAAGRPSAVATGHHLDDQAETLLMRLARGSGVDGLSAMAPDLPYPVTDMAVGHGDSPIRLLRPFLDTPKSRLVATLSCLGQTWVEDPGNRDPGFERVRMRQLLARLADEGIEPVALARSATRLARARAALEAATDDLARKAVDAHDGAYVSIDPALFDEAPAEIRLRTLQRTWRAMAPSSVPPDVAGLEALVDRLADAEPFAATLGGAQIRRTMSAIQVFREPGRRPLPVLRLEPGAAAIWDGRFRIIASMDAGAGLEIRSLDAQTLTSLARSRCLDGRPKLGLPRQALLTLPALWDANRLLAVFHPAFGTAENGRVSARFIGLEPVDPVQRAATT